MPIQIGKKPESDFTNPLGLLSDCHRRIERFLSVVIAVAREAKGGELISDQRNALAVALRYFREAAPKHTLDEEESLFPRMLAARHPESAEARALIEILHQDHKDADAWHAEADRLGTEWLVAGRLDEAKLQRFNDLLGELSGTYERHIQAEDVQVFPLAGRILDSRELQSVGKEMAARRGIVFDFAARHEKIS